jgi:hypothetical protein
MTRSVEALTGSGILPTMVLDCVEMTSTAAGSLAVT